MIKRWTVTLAAVAVLVLPVLAQSGPEARGEDKVPFSIAISMPATELRSGSQVWVDVTLTNTADQILMVPRIQLVVRDMQGRPAKLTREAEAEESQGPAPGSQRGTFIDPGKSVESDEVISKSYDLSRPGEYVVQAVASYGGLKAKSNQLTVIITDSGQEVPSAGPFTLTVTSPHNAVKQGSTILLKVRLVNTSNRDLSIDNTKFDLLIEDTEGNSSPATEASKKLKKQQVEPSFHNLFSLHPGETLRTNIEADKFYVLGPGKYLVHLQKVDDETKSVVKSNPVTVTVVR